MMYGDGKKAVIEMTKALNQAQTLHKIMMERFEYDLYFGVAEAVLELQARLCLKVKKQILLMYYLGGGYLNVGCVPEKLFLCISNFLNYLMLVQGLGELSQNPKCNLK